MVRQAHHERMSTIKQQLHLSLCKKDEYEVECEKKHLNSYSHAANAMSGTRTRTRVF